MSQISASYYDEPLEAELSAPPQAASYFAPRSRWLPMMFLPAVLVTFLSYISGGISALTDCGFLLLTLGCILCFMSELRNFSRRFGIAGLVLFGGTLVWYCHDYFSNWFMGGLSSEVGGRDRITPATLAKAAMATSLFVMCASWGLLIPAGKWLERWLTKVPEPANPNFHFVMVMVLCLIGISPYFIFVGEPFYSAIYKDMFAMRGQAGAAWTVGRTGNLNYNWGGYVVHIYQIGWLGALLGAAYALFLARDVLSKLICWAWYIFWMMLVFGTGTRGYVVALGLPVAFLIFIKYHDQAAQFFRRYSVRAYLYSVVALFVFLGVIQFQGTFRTSATEERSLGDVALFKNRGNHMFSEALLAYQIVPSEVPHPGVMFPGAGFVMPLPDTAMRFGIGWIPRALWHNKPGFDDFATMYNTVMSGGSAENTTGATICTSIAGGAYIAWGIPGVIEMGLLFGWLCIVSERVFLGNKNKLIVMLFGLGLATWLFRCFRDLSPHDLYPLLIGIAAYTILVMPFKAPEVEG